MKDIPPPNYSRIQRVGETDLTLEQREEWRDFENFAIWGPNWRETVDKIKQDMSAVDFEYCKDEAIAFGEWIADQCYTRTFLLGDVVYPEGVWHQSFSSTGKTHTTEELYELFLKSK